MTEAVETFERYAKIAGYFLESAPPQRVHDAALYLAHIEAALPLRTIAMQTGRSVSTVHRAVRRIEALRDDPLLDRAIEALGEAVRSAEPPISSTHPIEGDSMIQPKGFPADRGAKARAEAVDRIGRRALERLAEPDAFLLVASGAERAGVFSRTNGYRRPLNLVPVAQAADFAARDWVRCVSRTAASSKYVLTPVGRAWLRHAAGEAAVGGAREMGDRQIAGADGRPETIRVNLAESPVTWLARRKGPDGSPLLAPVEVEAAERLRDDFEQAQIGPRVTQDWRSFLTPREAPGQGGRSPCEGPTAARDRVSRALGVLGPGLSDVTLRVCCFLEGLEAVENHMGWSARSGKVVLKLALQRLAEHYGLQPGGAG